MAEPAPEQQFPTSGPEAVNSYPAGKREEMKPCHRLDVTKKLLDSNHDSPRPANNSDVGPFDRQ